MRNPARIDRILALLAEHWHVHPDLRLGQIVGNFTPRVKLYPLVGEWDKSCDDKPGDSYYVEDDVIEAALLAARPPAPGEVKP